MTTSLLKFAGAAAALLMVSACAGSTVEGPDLNADQRGDGQIVQTGPAAGSQEHLEQNAGHRVFFGYNQYTLTAQAQATLARQADWLKGNPGVGVTLAGNADERGTREYNLALGARRAEAARAYLVSLGIDRDRVRTVSYGKERPLDPRSTEEAWSLNRNSTTTIRGGASS